MSNFYDKAKWNRTIFAVKKDMIKPVVAYGNPVLRTECTAIDKDFPNLDNVINDMWDTLENADGCGLAAPQINLPVRLFVVNSRDMYLCMSVQEREHYFQGDTGIKETFINAEIINYDDNKYWVDEEGCLSIPHIHEAVNRAWSITIRYMNRDFQEQTKLFYGETARVIQHEFDHTRGKLYIDYLSPLRKQLIKNKLTAVIKGKIKTQYPMWNKR